MNEDLIRDILDEFFARSKVCQKYGIALKDVVDGTAVIPPGWELDIAMEYYMPPTLLES